MGVLLPRWGEESCRMPWMALNVRLMSLFSLLQQNSGCGKYEIIYFSQEISYTAELHISALLLLLLLFSYVRFMFILHRFISDFNAFSTLD